MKIKNILLLVIAITPLFLVGVFFYTHFSNRNSFDDLLSSKKTPGFSRIEKVAIQSYKGERVDEVNTLLQYEESPEHYIYRNASYDECNHIGIERVRNECYHEIAHQKGDKRICDLITSSNIYNGCTESIENYLDAPFRPGEGLKKNSGGHITVDSERSDSFYMKIRDNTEEIDKVLGASYE